MRILKISLLVFILSSTMSAQNFWQPMGAPMGIQLYQFNVDRSNNLYVSGNGIYRSDDLGTTWVPFGLPDSWIIDFDNNNIVYIADDGWDVYRSINNGLNWTLIYSCVYEWCRIAVDTNNDIYLGVSSSSQNHALLKSTDFGNNWNQIYSIEIGFNHYWGSLDITKQDHIYWKLLDRIIRSTDSGNSFEEFLFPNGNISSFTINSSGFMFISDYLYIINVSVIKRSTDDGQTWEDISGISGYVVRIYAASNDELFCCVDGMGVIKSTNDGISWEYINDGLVNYNNQDIVEDSIGYLYLATNGDGVFRSIHPITSVNDGLDNNPKNFALIQNYPNPFNPSTKIKYTIPASLNPSKGGTLVQLVVYDILGREVTVLVNEEKQPGVYEIEFDGSNITSGVYLYRLTAGEFSDTQKLVLLK